METYRINTEPEFEATMQHSTITLMRLAGVRSSVAGGRARLEDVEAVDAVVVALHAAVRVVGDARSERTQPRQGWYSHVVVNNRRLDVFEMI